MPKVGSRMPFERPTVLHKQVYSLDSFGADVFTFHVSSLDKEESHSARAEHEGILGSKSSDRYIYRPGITTVWRSLLEKECERASSREKRWPELPWGVQGDVQSSQ